MSFAISPSGVKITLEDQKNQKIWEDLHPNNEIIATKCGRRMFPSLNYKIEGLDSQTLYFIDFHLERVDNNKYEYENQEWRDAGRGEPILPIQYKMHPDGARPGSHWMENIVSFSYIKISNDPENKNDKCILVQSMHKYLPVVTVRKIGDNRGEEFLQGEEFRLDLTQFFAVTAYESKETAAVKIANNPFAQGFLMSRQASTLTADPPACTVPALGGSSTHKLVNTGAEKMIFKIKSSNNNEYRITPVFGFIDPFGSKDFQITRFAGAPKEDKLVAHFAVAPADATDAQAAFASVASAGTVTIPMSATA